MHSYKSSLEYSFGSGENSIRLTLADVIHDEALLTDIVESFSGTINVNDINATLYLQRFIFSGSSVVLPLESTGLSGLPLDVRAEAYSYFKQDTEKHYPVQEVYDVPCYSNANKARELQPIYDSAHFRPFSVARARKSMCQDYISSLVQLSDSYQYIYAGILEPAWGHFLLEVLTRLIPSVQYARRFSSRKPVRILFSTWNHKAYRDRSTFLSTAMMYHLSPYGITNDDVIIVDSSPCSCKELLVAGAGALLSPYRIALSRDASQAIHNHGRLALSFHGHYTISEARNVYLSRRTVAYPHQGRRIANEEEVEKCFAFFNFRIFHIDDKSAHGEMEKLACLEGAKYIGGLIGSNLLNGLFWPQAEFIVLTNRYIVRQQVPSVFQMCAFSSLFGHHTHVFYDHDSCTSNSSDWVVDIARLEEYLSMVVN